MLTFNPVKKPRDELAALERMHANFVAERQTLAANPPDAGNFDARLQHTEDLASLGRKIACANDSIDAKRAELVRAEAVAAEKLADARHAEMTKKASANRRLVLEIDSLANQLANKLQALSEHCAEVEKFNRDERGTRPFVCNAEILVRGQPEVTVPAVFEEQEVWADANGRRASMFKTDPRTGEMVPADQREYTKQRVSVQLERERVKPAHTPESYTKAIRLVDLAGNQIGPRR